MSNRGHEASTRAVSSPNQPSECPKLLLSCAGEGILGLDRDGAITCANPAGAALLARKPAELRRRPVCEWLHPSELGTSRADPPCPVCTALATGARFRGDALLHVDGKEVPIALSCEPILEGSHTVGAVLVLQDASERLRTEAALRRSEAKYRELVEHAAIGIFRSNPQGRLLSVNAALVSMLGYESSDALRSVPLQDIYVDPGDRSRLLETHDTRSGPRSEVVRWRHRDGTELRVRLSWRAVEDDAGRPQTFETFAQDVTRAAVQEQQLRHSQKMEAIGQLTGGMAHDFNNELSIILLGADLIAEAIAGERSVEPHLSQVRQAAKRAASITGQLLGFSRRAELAPETVDLGDLVRGMSCVLRAMLPETIDVAIETGEGPYPAVVDSNAVEQCLVNLVANARDAMPDGGVLSIRVHDVHVLDPCAGDGPPPGRYACLEVADDGTGMDAAVRARVFDPFFTTKPKDRGTGLGLAMVFGLTHQQSGYTSVVSEEGSGSTFQLWFPYADSAVVSPCGPASPTPAPDRRGTETVLVVEDDAPLLETTACVLSGQGYEVLVARCGEEALAALAQHDHVDLVVSDLVLPSMSGLALRDRILEGGSEIPFVLTSGYCRRDAEKHYGLNGCVPFVQKPWSRDDLLCGVRRALDRSKLSGGGR